MEAPKTLVLPGKVNIISYGALGSAPSRPVRNLGGLDLKIYYN